MLIKRSSMATSLGILLLLLSFSVAASGFKTDPYMKSTRTQLMKARAHLFAGEADKGGHRAKAIAYTSQAIDEVEKALKANHHHHAQSPAASLTTSASFEATFQGSHMRKAVIHLKQAKENIGAAAPDQGGHRAKAIELIDKAIEEVELANAGSAWYRREPSKNLVAGSRKV